MIVVIDTCLSRGRIGTITRSGQCHWTLLADTDRRVYLERINQRCGRGGVSQCTGIIVATGPGSFSGVRTGVAIANALAFALGIPVVSIRSGLDQPALIAKAVNQLNRAAHHLVRPKYDQTWQPTLRRN